MRPRRELDGRYAASLTQTKWTEMRRESEGKKVGRMGEHVEVAVEEERKKLERGHGFLLSRCLLGCAEMDGGIKGTTCRETIVITREERYGGVYDGREEEEKSVERRW